MKSVYKQQITFAVGFGRRKKESGAGQSGLHRCQKYDQLDQLSHGSFALLKLGNQIPGFLRLFPLGGNHGLRRAGGEFFIAELGFQTGQELTVLFQFLGNPLQLILNSR